MHISGHPRPLVKGVEIVHSEAATAPDAAMTDVHFREEGHPYTRRISVGRPVNFDHIVTSRVQDVVPGFGSGRRQDLSVRGVARKVGFGAVGACARRVRPQHVDAPIFDSRVCEPNNMAHLLMDIVPCCLHARRVIGTDVMLLSRSLQPAFEQLLGVFGIKPVKTLREIEGGFVRVCGTRGLAVYDLLGQFDCPTSASLPHAYDGLDLTTSVGFDRVFFARRGARALVNHQAVEDALHRYGYRTVFMEDYSIRDQLSIGARARHVVGVHGAAMGFLAVGKTVESVVELMPSHVYHELFAMCVQPHAKHYHLIISEFDPSVAHSGWSAIAHFKGQPFSVDLPLLEQSLAAIH